MTEATPSRATYRTALPRRLSSDERARRERRWKRLILVGTLGFMVGLTGLIAGLNRSADAVSTTADRDDDAPRLAPIVQFRTRTS
jgi:hypothetical protein